VTEVLNTSQLKPVDPSFSSIELHSCYCVRSVVDELFYRAEVIEICYGDDKCPRRNSADSCASCWCDQIMCSPTASAKAVRV